MSPFKEYSQYDGMGLAQLIQGKEVSASEVLDSAIKQAQQLNPKINAIINPLFERAQQASDNLPKGIFSGVPFLLKDILADLRGVPTSNGSKAYQGLIPNEDAELVSRFKQTGVNVFGKTNTPEMGLKGITEPTAFGATLNPWDTRRTPGGSSGGRAAAVAARIAPMASSSDGGGSIRIPAAHCGLFGLKPSRGRNPCGPLIGEQWDGASCEHVLTRSVRDSAAMLDATQGGGIGSAFTLSPPEQSYLSALQKPPRKLRIGFSTVSPYGGKVDSECIKAIENTGKLLQNLGHQVEEKTPNIDGDMLLNSYLSMYFGHVAAEVTQLKSKLGKQAINKLEDDTRFLALLGECLSAGDFVNAKHNWFNIKKVMDIYHQDFDLLLIPSTASLAVPIGSLEMSTAQRIQTKVAIALGSSVAGLFKKPLLDLTIAEARKNLDKTPFTQLANITGQPAMSVPLHYSDSGLPCGVQFVAPSGDEFTLFQLAAQLEKAQPWDDKMPELIKGI